VSAKGREASRPSSGAKGWPGLSAHGALAAGLCLLGCMAACSSAGPTATATAHDGQAPPDAPLVAAQPGAWFDAQGNLTIVGAGRRLRLVLSAPVSACAPAFQSGGSATELSTRVSLPFHVVSEVCRETHPTILLAEESDAASPAELERSYHEVAHCAAADWGLSEGWIPKLVEDNDPCPLALGLGWRLPSSEELQGLTVDDRKALAGALFDTENNSAFAGLVLYARGKAGLSLVTLSPNAAEQAPTLTDEKRGRPLLGAALRCTRDPSADPKAHPPLPVLPHAAECLRAQRLAQGLAVEQPSFTPPPELQKLRAWVDLVKHTPKLWHSEPQLQELSRLLASPAIEQLAREAREERSLTEHYAELAEGLDDPAVSEGERARRHAEFDSLRKRLGGQIVHKAEGGTDRTQLAALLAHVQAMLDEAARQSKSAKHGAAFDYRPLQARVHELASGKAAPR
jgi:hypothetical protein